MIVRNETPYGDREVTQVIERGMGMGRKPKVVIVHYRRRPDDDREGFTPFDDRHPTEFWVEPAARYPQAGARCWQDELVASAGHEAWHFRHQDAPCANGSCERLAERHGQARRRRYQYCRVGAPRAAAGTRPAARRAPKGRILRRR